MISSFITSREIELMVRRIVLSMVIVNYRGCYRMVMVAIIVEGKRKNFVEKSHVGRCDGKALPLRLRCRQLDQKGHRIFKKTLIFFRENVF